MPHINIEFSANIADAVEPQRLVDIVHAAALELGTFPPPGLKTRATRVDFCRIADGDPRNAFVHVRVRMSPGTSHQDKRNAAERLLAVASEYLDEIYRTRPMSITVEVLELDRNYHLRHNNIEEAYARREVRGRVQA